MRRNHFFTRMSLKHMPCQRGNRMDEPAKPERRREFDRRFAGFPILRFHSSYFGLSVVGILPTVRGPAPKIQKSSRMVRPMYGPDEVMYSPLSAR